MFGLKAELAIRLDLVNAEAVSKGQGAEGIHVDNMLILFDVDLHTYGGC